jgi:nuclear transport factor 2 (NTF2) superfamily protein
MDALKQELKRVCSAMRNAELSFEMWLIKTTQIKFRSKLEARDCEHFKAFGTRGFEFPSSGEMPTPSKTVDTITKIILRKFWAESGREHA